MKCPKCQADNSEDAEFCSLCYARFQVGVRSLDEDEEAQRIKEKHEGSMLRCPSCGATSPLDSQFCLRCGFVFENLESLLVSQEEIDRLKREEEEHKAEEQETLAYEPVIVTAEADGAEIMRSLDDILARGQQARIHCRGREAVTYAMKIVALMGEDLRAKGRDIRLKASLMSDGTITHLDDVELEIILENV
jgi:ribosomal protein L40E